MLQLQFTFLLQCDECDRFVAPPRHKLVTGATLLQLEKSYSLQLKGLLRLLFREYNFDNMPHIPINITDPEFSVNHFVTLIHVLVTMFLVLI